MTETSTTPNNSLTNNEVVSKDSMELTESERDFYAGIQHQLDTLRREPSENTIQNILNYSKSL